LYLDSGEKPKKMTTPEKPLVGAFSPDEFRAFELKKVEPYNHNTSKLTFKLPEGTASLLPVAACVVITADDSASLKDDKGNPIVRPYTPTSKSDHPGEVEFIIKKYDTGKVTPHLHNMKVGDKINIKGPFAKHQWKSNEFEQTVLIAGGSGITPMYQILQHSFSLPDDKTKFKLIFGNVSPKDILLREEFDAWVKQHPDRLEVIYLVDKGDENWKGLTGYVTKELLQKELPPPSDGNKFKIFVCGPPGQMSALCGPKASPVKQGELTGTLKDMGYTSDQVFKF
jgi:cytochrome-b5 reductase